MSAKDYANFNVKGYAFFLRCSFIFLGVSSITLSMLLNHIADKNWTIPFFVLYILVSICIIFFSSLKFLQKKDKKTIMLLILFTTITIVCGGFNIYKNTVLNELVISDNEIIFTENYGKKILFTDIKNIQITNLLPKIKFQLNGFSLGDIQKGKFKIETDEIVHFMINGKHTPILKITTKDDKKLFFNSNKKNIKEEYIMLQNIFSYQKKPLSK